MNMDLCMAFGTLMLFKQVSRVYECRRACISPSQCLCSPPAGAHYTSHFEWRLRFWLVLERSEAVCLGLTIEAAKAVCGSNGLPKATTSQETFACC
jgi:hypothetical protein